MIKVMDKAIIITNLTKITKGKYILKNINLSIERGKICGIVGRNGSGKSMLFKIISGLVYPSEGRVEVFGDVIGKDVSFPKDFGAIIEHPGFLPQYSGYKNLKLLASIKNIINDDEIKNAMTIVGLDYNDKKPVKKYSLGMKQRLGIAQAIMEKPKLLILDEPMNGLDKQGVESVRELLKSLNAENNVTILMASHNSEDINLLCDEVYEIDNGILSKL